MLAFLDNPLGLAAVFVLVLLLFGPEKLPQIANQLGRALRELKRTTSDFRSSLDPDTHFDSPYQPGNYSAYGDSYPAVTGETSAASVGASPAAGETTSIAGVETPHGDSAAPALAESSSEYETAAPAGAATGQPVPRAAESTVPRGGIMGEGS